MEIVTQLASKIKLTFADVIIYTAEKCDAVLLSNIT